MFVSFEYFIPLSLKRCFSDSVRMNTMNLIIQDENIFPSLSPNNMIGKYSSLKTHYEIVNSL